MNPRKLNLKREALTELTTTELGSVVGGTHAGCDLTAGCTHGLSIEVECPVPSNPLTNCATIGSPCIQTQTR